MTNESDAISPAGIARLKAIRLLAGRAAGRRRRVRRVTARLAAVTMGLALLTAASLVALHRPKATITPIGSFLASFPASSPTLPPIAPMLVRRPPDRVLLSPPSHDADGPVVYLPTDPTLTARLSIPPALPRWTSLNDNQLLTVLAAAGRPACLLTVNGRESVLFQTPSR